MPHTHCARGLFKALCSVVVVLLIVGLPRAHANTFSQAFCERYFTCIGHPKPVLKNLVAPNLEGQDGCFCVNNAGIKECKTMDDCLDAIIKIDNCFFADRLSNKDLDTYGKCKSCNQGYQLLDHPNPSESCFLCAGKINNCQLCDSSGKCLACARSLKATPDGTRCIECGENCVTCSQTGTCDVCQPGYVLYLGACVPCTVSGCTQCATGNKCTSCKAGYTISSDGSSCIQCDVENCNSCASTNQCSGCRTGYTWSSAQGRCIPCKVENCKSCTTDNICDVCQDGYQRSVDSTSCTSCDVYKCTGCAVSNRCDGCETGYTLSSDQLLCVACGIDNCDRCSAAGVCDVCKDGFSLAADRRSCFECSITGCATCSPDHKCAACKDGFKSVLGGVGCIPCALDGCESCGADSGTCSSCASGYALNGGACVECAVENCDLCVSPGDGKACAVCRTGFSLANGTCRKGIAWWLWLLIGLAGGALVAVLLFLVVSCCCCRAPTTKVEVENSHDGDSMHDCPSPQHARSVGEESPARYTHVRSPRRGNLEDVWEEDVCVAGETVSPNTLRIRRARARSRPDLAHPGSGIDEGFNVYL